MSSGSSERALVDFAGPFIDIVHVKPGNLAVAMDWREDDGSPFDYAGATTTAGFARFPGWTPLTPIDASWSDGTAEDGAPTSVLLLEAAESVFAALQGVFWWRVSVLRLDGSRRTYGPARLEVRNG